MRDFLAVIGLTLSIFASVAVYMTLLVDLSFSGCGKDEIAVPVFSKGIYCVQATKWIERPRHTGERG